MRKILSAIDLDGGMLGVARFAADLDGYRQLLGRMTAGPVIRTRPLPLRCVAKPDGGYR